MTSSPCSAAWLVALQQQRLLQHKNPLAHEFLLLLLLLQAVTG
jgi:hypothetical protein